MRIALASCRTLPEPDPDQDLLLAALRDAGAQARVVAWEDPADYREFDLCVIRSTWNYVHHHREFLDWARRVSAATMLSNPLEVVLWNTDKSYLKDLEERGIPVVPTVFLGRGAPAGLAETAAGKGWDDVVVKPRVGAASFATKRFSGPRLEEGETFLREALEQRDMMVQPYLASVEESGERALVWIAGAFTHGVRKAPRFSGAHEAVSVAVPVSADEEAFGRAVIESFRQDLLYARVDVVRMPDGSLALMELELVEPSLFLAQKPEALGPFAKACVEACRSR
ncbi:MAG: hypothetical protein HZB91_01400 [Elusimicrobia bacterium]|nr:hypothetical protein [Elusimicrobiota bacterium]